MRGAAILGLLAALFAPNLAIVSPDCNYYQDVVIDKVYYIYNPQYPNNYGRGYSCLWTARSPPNSKIIISCEIDIPTSPNCVNDALIVSTTGNANFNDGHRYCGRGSFSSVSETNRLAVGLFSTWTSPGGRFLCSVTAVQTGEPPSTKPPPGNCDCGWKKQQRIVGGVETGINEYPAMAALIDLLQRNLYCGASIISDFYALTAAHCVENRNPIELGLLVGDHDVESGQETNSAALLVLQGYSVHPDYVNVSQGNDVAVVRTQRRIEFSVNVGPICLPFRYTTSSLSGFSVTALGWGTTEFTGPKSDTLQAVNLTVITNRQCAAGISPRPLNRSQICTFQEGKDTCQSDSGGPLYFFDSSIRRLIQVGVVSYGLGCASDLPTVNTRVTSFLSWIVSVTSDAKYCIK